MALPAIDCDRLSSIINGQRRHTVQSKTLRPIKMMKLKRPETVPEESQTIYRSSQATLKRSKTKLHVTIHDELPNSAHTKTYQNSASSNQELKDEITERLKEQLADMVLALEEERLSHRETKKQAEELLNGKIKQIMEDHEIFVESIHQAHREEIEILKQTHSKELVYIKSDAGSASAKLKTELDILIGAFHSYKAETEAEYKRTLKEEEHKLVTAHKSELSRALLSLECQLKHESLTEITQLEREHHKKLSELRKEHRKNLELLNKRYSSQENHLIELEATKNALLDTKNELLKMAERYEQSEQISTSLQQSLADAKERILCYEADLEAKIHDLERNHSATTDRLIEDNTALRKQYIKKCQELSQMLTDHSIKQFD